MGRIEKENKSEKFTDNNADAMTRPTIWGLAWGVLSFSTKKNKISASPMPLLCRLVKTDSYEPTIAARSNSHAILVWSINYSPKKIIPSLVCLQRRIPSLSCVFAKASRRLWYPVPIGILIGDNSPYFLIKGNPSFSLPQITNMHAKQTRRLPLCLIHCQCRKRKDNFH